MRFGTADSVDVVERTPDPSRRQNRRSATQLLNCRCDLFSPGIGKSWRLRAMYSGIRDILDPKPAKDKYCAQCGQRLAFLRVLAAAREHRSE